MEDGYKHRGLRRKLVQSIRKKGINDESVLTALNTVPRHFFFDDAFLNHAYQDKAFPIAEEQTISQPYTVAFQTELLAVSKGNSILEIGTGSGYQASILCEMGARVYSIEYNQVLYRSAKKMLHSMGYHPVLKHGDGSKGWSLHAPYDGIIVTAGAPDVPQDLKDQLSLGGKLVIPVGNNMSQVMMRVSRLSEKEFKTEKFDYFAFVPLLGEGGWKN